MNKGRIGVDNFALSKPTWEIMKIISEITDFSRELIFGAIFGLRMYEIVEKNCYLAPRQRSYNPRQCVAETTKAV